MHRLPLMTFCQRDAFNTLRGEAPAPFSAVHEVEHEGAI